MLILRAGLYVAALFALYVTWASRNAGFPIEVATLRGLLTFMAVIFVAYLAELVVLTAPPRRLALSEDAEDEGYEDDEGDDETANLPALRADRDAAADQRRAA